MHVAIQYLVPLSEEKDNFIIPLPLQSPLKKRKMFSLR